MPDKRSTRQRKTTKGTERRTTAKGTKSDTVEKGLLNIVVHHPRDPKEPAALRIHCEVHYSELRRWLEANGLPENDPEQWESARFFFTWTLGRVFDELPTLLLPLTDHRGPLTRLLRDAALIPYLEEKARRRLLDELRAAERETGDIDIDPYRNVNERERRRLVSELRERAAALMLAFLGVEVPGGGRTPNTTQDADIFFRRESRLQYHLKSGLSQRKALREANRDAAEYAEQTYGLHFGRDYATNSLDAHFQRTIRRGREAYRRTHKGLDPFPEKRKTKKKSESS